MYKLGTTSMKNLEGVHPKLVSVVKRAIQVTTQDFGVHDGARTLEEQREYVRRGVSKTMRSNHLVQSDGLGHAVDLVPYINGKLRWEWPPIYDIAVAMAEAAREQGVKLTWGGVWDLTMNEYSCRTADQVKAAVERYKVRHPGSDFIDGPHYQIEL